MSMEVKQTIVPKKGGGGNTIVNYGFSSTVNNSGGNSNINTNNLSVTNLSSNSITASTITASQLTATNATVNNKLTANDVDVNGDLYSYATSYLNTAYVSTALHGESANAFFNNLTVSNSTNTKDLNVTRNATAYHLSTTNGASLGGTTLFDVLTGNNESRITVDYLDVLKSAHFFELIIDKIKASGGSVLITPADGFVVDQCSYTSGSTSYYTLYWQAAEDVYTEGYENETLSYNASHIPNFVEPAKLIGNMWETGDQAICQTFNARTGAQYNAANRYWWRVVYDSSTEPVMRKRDANSYCFYNWIKVYAGVDTSSSYSYSYTSYVAPNSVEPKVGDNVAMLGNRNCKQATASADIKRRGSAIYLATNESIDSELTAPLFATYNEIDNFNLASHRINKMDMNGTELTGRFVTDSGDILDGTSYRIVPSSNIITSSTSNNVTTVSPSTMTISFLYQANGVATLSTTVPTSYSLDWITYDSGGTEIARDTVIAGQSCQLTFTSNIDKLQMELYTTVIENGQSVRKVRDAVSMQVVYLNNLRDGKNGNETKWIYTTVQKTQEGQPGPAPTDISSIASGNQANGFIIPSGWTDQFPTLSTDSYDYWMSNGTVTYSSSNVASYTNWSKPIRITGEDGEMGTDGTDYEFIYKNFDTEQTSWGNNNNNPHYWDDTSNADRNNHTWTDRDYLGPVVNGTDYGWDDNPVGIGEKEFQYVSVRSKVNDTWGRFETPTLWSKWGEKGQDGDGVKYIFAKGPRANEAPHKPEFIWTSTDTANGYKDYTYASDTTRWYDEPNSYTDPTENYPTYCSQSVSNDGEWSNWSSPAIWATWAQPGVNGRDGVTRKLLPLNEKCNIELDYTSTNPLTCTGRFTTDLKYNVIEYNANNELTTIDLSSNSKYKIVSYIYSNGVSPITCYKQTSDSLVTSESNSYWYYDTNDSNQFWKWDSSNSYAYLSSAKEYENRGGSYNWLIDVNGTSYYSDDNYRDFYYLMNSTVSSYITRTPTRLEVRLMYTANPNASNPTWKIVDKRINDIVLPTRGTFEHDNYILRSVFTGSWVPPGETNPVHGISSLTQTVNDINLAVQSKASQSDISTYVNNYTYSKGEIDLKDNNIRLQVTKESVKTENLFKDAAISSSWTNDWQRYPTDTPAIARVTSPSHTSGNASLSINMRYDTSGRVFMPYVYQTMTKSFPADTQFMISCYLKITPASGQSNAANSVFGLDIQGAGVNATPIGFYIDDDFKRVGYTNNTNRCWGQIDTSDISDTEWHKITFICKTNATIAANKMLIRIFGWHSGTNDSTPREIDYRIQPYFYATEPIAYTDDGSTIYTNLSSKIDVTESNITSQVSTTYQRKDAMGNYSTTQEMNTAISQSAEEISLEVKEVAKGSNYLSSTDFISDEVLTSKSDTISLWYKFPNTGTAGPLAVSTSNDQRHDGYNSLRIDLNYAGPTGWGFRSAGQYIDVSEMPLNTDLCFSLYVKAGSTTSSSIPKFGVQFKAKNSPSDSSFMVDIPITAPSVKFVQSDGNLWTNTGQGGDPVPSGSTHWTRYFCERNPSDSKWNDTNWHQYYITFQMTSRFNYLFIDMYGHTNTSLYTTDLQFFVTQPQLIIGSQPGVFVNGTDGRYNEQIRRTGIDISQGKITLDATKTVVTGDFDLNGKFTSNNTTTTNKVYIDSYSEGLNIYGPDKIQNTDANPDLPDTGYTIKKIANLGWDNDNDIHSRTGKLQLYNAKNNNSFATLRAGTNNGSELTLQNEYPDILRDTLYINSEDQISFTHMTYNTSTSSWVQSESQSNSLLNVIGNGYSAGTYDYNRTIENTDNMVLISDNANANASPTRLTLPSTLTYGKQIIIFNNRNANVKIYAPSGWTLRGNGSQRISDDYKTVDAYRCAIFVCSPTNNIWYLISYT